MLRHEADDGLRVVMHRADDVDETEGAHQHVLVAMEVAALRENLVDVESFAAHFLARDFDLFSLCDTLQPAAVAMSRCQCPITLPASNSHTYHSKKNLFHSKNSSCPLSVVAAGDA